MLSLCKNSKGTRHHFSIYCLSCSTSNIHQGISHLLTPGKGLFPFRHQDLGRRLLCQGGNTSSQIDLQRVTAESRNRWSQLFFCVRNRLLLAGPAEARGSRWWFIRGLLIRRNRKDPLFNTSEASQELCAREGWPDGWATYDHPESKHIQTE